MKVLKYNEWKDTALSLHLVSQMLGKVKRERMTPQPEWNHTILDVTASGLTTGLIPNGEGSFCIDMNIREGRVETAGIDGRSSGFSFRPGTSTSEYFNDFNRMLADVTCETDIFTTPQEMSITTPFEKDTDKRDFVSEHATQFFHMCVYAHNALLKFVSPLRCRKILPRFFWGTFDISTVLFSGKPAPFSGGGIIEKVAFDEQLLEFGFWPGDDAVPDPSFFVLPYPFLTKDMPAIRPDKSVFSSEKKEYFLKLSDVLTYSDPEEALQQFFADAFALVTKTEGWENLDWFTQPLLV